MAVRWFKGGNYPSLPRTFPLFGAFEPQLRKFRYPKEIPSRLRIVGASQSRALPSWHLAVSTRSLYLFHRVYAFARTRSNPEATDVAMNVSSYLPRIRHLYRRPRELTLAKVILLAYPETMNATKQTPTEFNARGKRRTGNNANLPCDRIEGMERRAYRSRNVKRSFHDHRIASFVSFNDSNPRETLNGAFRRLHGRNVSAEFVAQ